MTKRNILRLLSIICSACLILTVLPMTAVAEDEQQSGHKVTIAEHEYATGTSYTIDGDDYCYTSFFEAGVIVNVSFEIDNDCGYYIAGAYVNGEYHKIDSLNIIFNEISFEMPDEDVTIEIVTEKITGHKVTIAEHEYAGGSTYMLINEGFYYTSYFDEGVLVNLMLWTNDGSGRRIAGAYINGEYYEAYTQSDRDGEISFVMPDKDVTVEIVTEEIPGYEVTFAEHAFAYGKSYALIDGECSYTSSFSAGADVYLQLSLYEGADCELIGAYINGEFYEVDEYGIISFTMPKKDVYVEIITNKLPGHKVTIAEHEHVSGNPYSVVDGEYYYSSYFEEGAVVTIPFWVNGDCALCICGAYVNDEYYEADSNDSRHGEITFIMPDEDVFVEAVTEELPGYRVTIAEHEYAGGSTYRLVDEAYYYTSFFETGETVNVMLWTLADCDQRILGAYINGKYCEVIRYSDKEGELSFQMPDKDVTIEIVTEKITGHKVTIAEHEYAHGGSYVEVDGGYYFKEYFEAGETVNLMLRAHDNCNHIVVGAYVNDEYYKADTLDSGNSIISFTMPDEDVTVEIVTKVAYTISVSATDNGEEIQPNYDIYDEDGNCIFKNEFAGGEVLTVVFYTDRLVRVTVNGTDVAFGDGEYTFTMPESDVKIELVYDSTEYNITVNSDHDYYISRESAPAGEWIWLEIESVPGYDATVYMNGEELEIDETYGYYEFYMPCEDVFIECVYEVNPDYVMIQLGINGFDIPKVSGILSGNTENITVDNSDAFSEFSVTVMYSDDGFPENIFEYDDISEWVVTDEVTVNEGGKIMLAVGVQLNDVNVGIDTEKMSINGEEYAIKDYRSYGVFYTVLCEIDPAAADPDVTDPDEMNPDETNPDETNPDVTDPEATDPDSTDPEGGEDNPDTGDIAGVIVMIIAIGLIGFGGIYASFKKRRTV